MLLFFNFIIISYLFWSIFTIFHCKFMQQTCIVPDSCLEITVLISSVCTYTHLVIHVDMSSYGHLPVAYPQRQTIRLYIRWGSWIDTCINPKLTRVLYSYLNHSNNERHHSTPIQFLLSLLLPYFFIHFWFIYSPLSRSVWIYIFNAKSLAVYPWRVIILFFKFHFQSVLLYIYI